MNSSLVAVWLALGVTLLGGCAEGGEPPDEGDLVAETAAVRMPAAVDLLLSERCGGCHASGGTALPALSEPAAVRAHLDRIIEVASNGTMPPWQPDRAFSTFEGDPRVSEAELDLLRSWRDGEAGWGSGFTDAALAGPSAPDRMSAEHNLFADPSKGMDYIACVAFEASMTQMGGLLTGFRMRSSHPNLTHHFILGVVASEVTGNLPAAGGEVTCDTPWTRIGAQIDLRQPERFPDDLAVPLRNGIRLLVQVHVNTFDTSTSGGEPFSIALEAWTKVGEGGRGEIRFGAIENRDFVLPAGEASTIVTAEGNIQTGTIVGLVPHMHLRGTAFSAWLVRAGEEPRWLVSIPAWDFWSQREYFFRPEERIAFGAGDAIQVQCTFDNSAGRQPMVRGIRLEPRDVSYGSSGLDEMCELGVMYVPAE